MPNSIADVATDKASRYLQQLCKHWAHRLAVTFDPARGSVDFGDGRSATLVASDSALTVTVHADAEAGLDELERIVADHLQRFAFRETLEFNWSRQS